MVAARLSAQHGPYDGPRPINLRQDVRPILELLDLVFGPTLDAEGRRTLSDSMSLSQQPAFVARLTQAATGLAPGFVWEENGRIVSNVSLLASRLEGRYLVANVAVHPAFRRRGIGRALMEETIDHLRARRGRTVLLQVQSDNAAAIRLYEELAFQTLGSMTTWDLTSSREMPPPVAGAPLIRPLRAQEWRSALALDQASVNPERHWPQPPPYDAYKSGLGRWLVNFFNGRQQETWVTADGQEQLIGLASIASEWGRPHQLSLRVAPAWRGRLEPHLLPKLLRRLRYLRRAGARLDHPAEDEPANQLLRQAGLRPRRTLTLMRLDII